MEVELWVFRWTFYPPPSPHHQLLDANMTKQERIHSAGPMVHSTVIPTLQTVLIVLTVLTVLKVLTVLNVFNVLTVLNV